MFAHQSSGMSVCIAGTTIIKQPLIVFQHSYKHWSQIKQLTYIYLFQKDDNKRYVPDVQIIKKVLDTFHDAEAISFRGIM